MSSQSIGSPATLSVRTSDYLRRFIVRHRIISALLIVGLCLGGAASSLIPRSFAVTNGGSMNAIDTPLTENFNTLATAGTPTWTDNTTIPGWYSSRILYQTGSGTSSTGGPSSVPAETGGNNTPFSVDPSSPEISYIRNTRARRDSPAARTWRFINPAKTRRRPASARARDANPTSRHSRRSTRKRWPRPAG